MIGLQMLYHRLHRLPALEPFAVTYSHGVESAAIDVLCGHQIVHAAVTQIYDGGGGFDFEVWKHNGGLLDLFGQGAVAVILVTREG